MLNTEEKWDIYRDWKLVETLSCPYCNNGKLVFSHASGYESHFSDSSFGCSNCNFGFGVRAVFGVKSLEEAREKIEKAGNNYRVYLKKTYLEELDKLNYLREMLKKDMRYPETVSDFL